MKNNIIYLIILLLTCSCSDFLEEKSHDKIIPKSVKDYSEFLYGEAYFRGDKTICSYLGLLTDDVKAHVSKKSFGASVDTRLNAYGYFCWQKEPEKSLSGGLVNDINWKNFYHSILICNIVITDIDEIKGSDTDKKDLLAEAYFIRAFNYFMLVNLYGEPYDKDNADKALGVPINDMVGMADIKFKRESVADNYALINDDLKKSIKLFEESGKDKSVYKANLKAALLLASRVALYTQDYKNCIEYSNKLIKKHPVLHDLNEFEKDQVFLDNKNGEVLFTYGYYSVNYYASAAKSNFPPSDELMASFESGDLRRNVFIPKLSFMEKWLGGVEVPKKSGPADATGMYGYAMRSAEAYLNRAEAYIQSEQIEKGLDDIRLLHNYRYSSSPVISAENKEDALSIVRKERRVELCFELHRWFDLRRYGCPELTHVFIRDAVAGVTETYKLEKDDKAYTLPIPYEVYQFNPKFQQINRSERKPLNNE